MSEQVVQSLSFDQIHTDPQARKQFDENALRGLALSVRHVGVLQPIRVRRDGDRLVIIDGERRYRAARLAGLASIPAIVEEQPSSPTQVLQKQLIANCQREDLTPVEKATALRELMQSTGWPAKEAATKLGLSGATVSRLLAVLKLPEEILKQVESGAIPVSAAYELARVADPGRQSELATALSSGSTTRDAVAGAARAERNLPDGQPNNASNRRSRAALGAARSVTVVGADTLDSLIAILEELLSKARKARPQGLGLSTFLKMLKDQAAS
jgi:ParB family transcriptional regulator, chromosome partitioning protein